MCVVVGSYLSTDDWTGCCLVDDDASGVVAYGGGLSWTGVHIVKSSE